MSSSNHYMVPSSSSDPMYQQMNQTDIRVQSHEQPITQNSSNRPMASDATQFNAPMTQEARHTYHHHNPPVAPQDPFQAQNLQKHQWNQEKRFQQYDNVHGSFHSQNLHGNQENWHHHGFMHKNHQNRQSCSSNFHNQRNMALNPQSMDQQFPQKSHGAPKNRRIPGNMNDQMFHQPAPDAARNSFDPDFMNTNNQPMNPKMPGTFQFLNDEFDQMNMAQVANHQTLHLARDSSLRRTPKNAELKPDFMNLGGPASASETPKDQPGPPLQKIPDNYMNYQMLHQPVRNAGKNQDLVNFNNQLMYPPMSQQHTHGTPGPSYFQGTTTNFQFCHMDQKNMAANQYMNQMPPQLAFGTYGTPNYVAQHSYGFPAPGQNPIVFNLLNAATWKFLSTLPNEMMIQRRNQIYNVKEKTWREVNRRKSEELAEKETNEVYSEVQTGQDIMDNGLNMKLVNIYTIGNEKKKARVTSGPMTEERTRMLERKKKIRAQKMIRVFSQQKYVPIFTLYQQMDFGTPQPIATTQFPDTEFITTTGYRNETVKKWKRNNNEFVRGDLRNLDI